MTSVELYRHEGAICDSRDDRELNLPPEVSQFVPAGDTPCELVIEWESSGYYSPQSWESREQIASIEAMSDAQAEAESEKAFQAEVARRSDNRRERLEIRNRYEAMIAKVDEWTPPTADHVRMKEFMREQLTQSIDWDCGNISHDDPKRLTGAEWRENRLSELRRTIRFAEKNDAEERQRADERNAWVRALRESLGATAVAR